ncbi:MAG TPA: disulfide bond formation protein B [Acetobacteraceae bacterium]|nr:disulfide bond formation protein B [Acetobacteraceae bacterium]
MPRVSLRTVALLSLLVAFAALAFARSSEYWGGFVPCALCLLERWPLRIVIVLGMLGMILPRPASRVLLGLAALTMLGDAAIAFVHIGVEFHWWRSPLPECAAPVFHGGTIAERLASMPARPSKPCDQPTFLIPGLPVSFAMMNLWFSLAFAAVLGLFVWNAEERRP